MTEETAATDGSDTTTGAEQDASSFKAITSQEELDRLIGARVHQVKSQYSDYDDLKAAAKKLSDLEEANKSEATKAAEKIAALEAQVAEATANALRAKTAAEAGLPVELLTASDEDGLKEQVKALQAWSKDQKKNGATVPAEGRTPSPPKADDKKAFANFLTGRPS